MELSAETQSRLKRQVSSLRTQQKCCVPVLAMAIPLSWQSLVTQVEFYFSDSNLPRDRFLRGKTEQNEQVRLQATTPAYFVYGLPNLSMAQTLLAQGFVDLKTVCSFSRMAAILDVSDKAAAKLSDSLLAKVNLAVWQQIALV